jgi:hypothetical protein
MTLGRARRDAGGTKAAAQAFDFVDRRSARFDLFTDSCKEDSLAGSFKAQRLCRRSVSVMPRFRFG